MTQALYCRNDNLSILVDLPIASKTGSSARSRNTSLLKLEELLGGRYADFEVLNSIEKMSYVFGSELWKQNFKSIYLA